MSRLEVLAEARLLRGCSQDQLDALDAVAVDRELRHGELILTQGDEASELMIVLSGEVQLEIPMSILGQATSIAFESKTRGDVVGWSCLVPPYRFTLNARVDKAVVVASFSRSSVLALFEADPGFGLRIMTNLASIVGQRLDHTHKLWAGEIERGLAERYR